MDSENSNMLTQLYVENLAAATSADAVIKLFSKFGSVMSAYVVVDVTDQKLRGFGYVTMATAEGAAAAIQSLHGQPAGAQGLHVRQASAREMPGAARKSSKRASAKIASDEAGSEI